MTTRRLSIAERRACHTLEDVVGCKWSAGIVMAIATGVTRPGGIERAVPGISTKVLHERLRRLVAFGLASRTELPAAVRHVEYRLTPVGHRVADIITQLRELAADLPPPPSD